jgi:hypothetical protein
MRVRSLFSLSLWERAGVRAKVQLAFTRRAKHAQRNNVSNVCDRTKATLACALTLTLSQKESGPRLGPLDTFSKVPALLHRR